MQLIAITFELLSYSPVRSWLLEIAAKALNVVITQLLLPEDAVATQLVKWVLVVKNRTHPMENIT